ncbi:hypothetical protein CDAR_398951 [Caerostris darwini]|uniref:Uncharacterized protein n=1 Tax=Caerostris darwini TaxID=1538125 RepID=A0AAV4WMK5_9ARAC|nr:hypothetical protein CDAR_398951 [Caerostris darwini]
MNCKQQNKSVNIYILRFHQISELTSLCKVSRTEAVAKDLGIQPWALKPPSSSGAYISRQKDSDPTGFKKNQPFYLTTESVGVSAKLNCSALSLS